MRKRLEEGFTYKTDIENHGKAEFWKNCAELVRAKRQWAGDCDDYAISAAHLLIEDEGIPQEDVALVYCTVETGGHHLVCFVSDRLYTWVIDNRQRTIWKAKQLPYRYISGLVIGSAVWRKLKV